MLKNDFLENVKLSQFFALQFKKKRVAIIIQFMILEIW